MIGKAIFLILLMGFFGGYIVYMVFIGDKKKRERIPYRIVLNANGDYAVQYLYSKNGNTYWADRYFYDRESFAISKYSQLVKEWERKKKSEQIIKVIDVK